MHIEIWSDLMCPFCYIGKRNFETALEDFEHRDEVRVTWRSFQLAPDMPHRLDGDVHDYLGAKYGGGREAGKAMNDRVTETAAAAGLEYNLDTAVMGNTFDPHRLTHLAAQHGLQDEAEERLFRAYFTESRHLADHDTLVELGTDIGLDAEAVRAMLAGDDLADAVRADVADAHRLGITGVPAFVVERRYAITGAQPPELILRALQQIWADERQPANT
jgi:predicted DsbA family dithiol-disulfide isomerase